VVKVVSQKATLLPEMDGIPYILQWSAPSPSKLPLPMGIWMPFNIWFIGHTWVHNQKGISISSAVFPGLMNMTDKHLKGVAELPYR